MSATIFLPGPASAHPTPRPPRCRRMKKPYMPRKKRQVVRSVFQEAVSVLFARTPTLRSLQPDVLLGVPKRCTVATTAEGAR